MNNNVTITSTSDHITLAWVGRTLDIKCSLIEKFELTGDIVSIIGDYLKPEDRDAYQTDFISIKFSDVLSPVYADGAALRAGLIAMAAAGSSSTLLTELIDRVEELNGGYSVLVGKPSGGDFTTSYNDATSLDCDSMPVTHSALIAEDIEIVQQIDSTGSVVETYMRDEVAMVVTNPAGSTYRITIAAATFAASDTFVVKTNIAVSTNTTITIGSDTYTEAVSRGMVMAAVRNDAGTTLVDTDGEFAPLMVNATGMLNVNLDQVRDTAPEIGAGNAGGGTLRVSIATDDVNLAAINEATVGLGTIAVVTNAAVGVAAEQLVVASTPCKRTFVTAHPDNTGRITVGASGVTDGNGVVLYAADTVEIQIDDVNKLYVIASVADEDVSATYLT